MRTAWVPAPAIDPVGSAGVLAAITGSASIAWPFFEGLTGALVALALAGWLLRVATPRARPPVPTPILLAVLLAVAAGSTFYLFPPQGWAILRGAALGVPAIGLAVTGGRAPAFGGGE